MDTSFNTGSTNPLMDKKISTFTAFAIETATGLRSSICQLSFVRVSNGVITERYTSLVQPPFNEYSESNIKDHGIVPAMTRDLPQFPLLWRKIGNYFTNEVVVAYCHEFDIDALTNVLELYGLEVPAFNFICAFSLYKCLLAEACEQHNVDLIPENKLSEAEACAKLFLINQSIKAFNISENKTLNNTF